MDLILFLFRKCKRSGEPTPFITTIYAANSFLSLETLCFLLRPIYASNFVKQLDNHIQKLAFSGQFMDSCSLNITEKRYIKATYLSL